MGGVEDDIDKVQQQQQLVFVPMPEVGHLASMVELAKRLLHLSNNNNKKKKKNNLLTITILTPTLPFSAISAPRSTSTPNLNFVDLPYLDSPELLQASGTACYPLVATLLKPAIRDTLHTTFPKVNALVFDFFFIVPMLELAAELAIPSYVYFPSNAAMFGIFGHLAGLKDEDSNAGIGGDAITLAGFVDPVPVRMLPSFMWEGYDVQGFHSTVSCARKVGHLKGVIVNTLPELEAAVTGLLPGGPPVYPVGPVLDLDGLALASRWKPTADDDDDDQRGRAVMEWLDGQPERSVVFLSFGSRGAFGPAQVVEIAHGLELSGQRFLWSLRRPPTAAHESPADYAEPEEVLPAGFQERAAGKGLVCGWAPQGRVLGHPAVGGFVSHCGWNSVVESLWCGVPIMGWPIYAEQRLNAYMLVKELGLAHAVKPNYLDGTDLLEAYTDGGDRVSREEVGNGVRRLLNAECHVRERVRDVSSKMRAAVGPDGSSSACLVRLLESFSDNN